MYKYCLICDVIITLDPQLMQVDTALDPQLMQVDTGFNTALNEFCLVYNNYIKFPVSILVIINVNGSWTTQQ